MNNTRRSVFFGLALLTAISAAGCAKPLDQQNSTSNSSSSSNSNDSNQTNTLKLYSTSTVLKPLASTSIYATGGTAPYTYSVALGGGRVEGSTYIAGSVIETVTLRAVDAVGAQAYATLAIISPVELAVGSSSLATDGSTTLTPSGGTAPYTLSLVSGGGSLSGNVYQAPAYATTAKLQAVDAQGYVASAFVTVSYYAPVVISPEQVRLYPGETLTLSASGGSGQYSYALISGTGSLNGTTYIAPASATVAKVQVTDTFGKSAVATVRVETKTLLSKTATFRVDDSALLTFNLPVRTDRLASIVIGGAGPDRTFGKNVSQGNATSMGAAPASAALALDNLDRADLSPYVGKLLITGRSGSSSLSFCVNPGESILRMQHLASDFWFETDTRGISYGAYAANTSAGTSVEGLWILSLDRAGGAGNASIQVTEGAHDHSIADCSGYVAQKVEGASAE
jgi:hypothetical protein